MYFSEGIRNIKIPTIVYNTSPLGAVGIFICFRNKEFKFVECKAKYEQLSVRQRLCIARLQQLGFVVEIYSLVGAATKARRALLDVRTNEKRVIERDMTVRVYD